MNWILLALISALFYGAYNFFIKLTSDSTHEVVGAVILQFSALMVGLIALYFSCRSDEALAVTRDGVYFAVLAGITAGLAEIISFYVFSQGVPVFRGVPVIIGGSIVAGSLMGVLFLREAITIKEVFGVLLVVAGIYLLTSARESNI